MRDLERALFSAIRSSRTLWRGFNSSNTEHPVEAGQQHAQFIGACRPTPRSTPFRPPATWPPPPSKPRRRSLRILHSSIVSRAPPAITPRAPPRPTKRLELARVKVATPEAMRRAGVALLLAACLCGRVALVSKAGRALGARRAVGDLRRPALPRGCSPSPAACAIAASSQPAAGIAGWRPAPLCRPVKGGLHRRWAAAADRRAPAAHQPPNRRATTLPDRPSRRLNGPPTLLP